MEYFVSWTYKGNIMRSGIYDFKYYINDENDFDYLRTEIAKNHTFHGASLNPLLINIINFFVLDEKPPTVTDSRYKYSIVYSANKQINETKEYCIFQKMMIFNTEIRTKNNINDIISRLEEDSEASNFHLISFVLIEVLENIKEEDAQN